MNTTTAPALITFRAWVIYGDNVGGGVFRVDAANKAEAAEKAMDAFLASHAATAARVAEVDPTSWAAKSVWTRDDLRVEWVRKAPAARK